jgi:hypothetical protein
MGARSTKNGVYPIFLSSRRKPTSNMAEAAEAKYAKGDIVLVPFPASFKRKSDISKWKVCLCPRLKGGLDLYIRCNCRKKREMHWVMRN